MIVKNSIENFGRIESPVLSFEQDILPPPAKIIIEPQHENVGAFDVKKVSVPGLVLSHIAGYERSNYYAYYYKLKFMYRGGVILNYRKRLKEIGMEIDRGEGTVRSFIGWAIENGYCIVRDGHLFFISHKKMCKMFKPGMNVKKDFLVKRFKASYAGFDKLCLQYLIICERDGKRNYRLRKLAYNMFLESDLGSKLNSRERINSRIAQYGGMDGLLNKMRSYFHSKGDYKSLRKLMFLRGRRNIASILQLGNRHTKQAGSYVVGKLRERGFVEKDKAHWKKVGVYCGEIGMWHLGDMYGRKLFRYGNDMFYRLPNELVFKKPEVK